MQRQKAANIFAHDSNARNDQKILQLRMKHKAAGYGVYFMILERLMEETDNMSVVNYNMLAYDFRVDAALVKSVVEDFGLFVFTPDGKYFYSERLSQQMDVKDELSKKRSKAGAEAMKKRWSKKKQAEEDAQEDKNTSQQPTEQPKQQQEDTSQQAEDNKAENIEKEVKQLKADELWLDSLQCLHHLTKERLRMALDDFLKECRASGKLYHNSLNDAKHHFNCWLRIINQKTIDNAKTATANAKRRGALLDAHAEKTKDYGSSF